MTVPTLSAIRPLPIRWPRVGALSTSFSLHGVAAAVFLLAVSAPRVDLDPHPAAVPALTVTLVEPPPVPAPPPPTLPAPPPVAAANPPPINPSRPATPQLATPTPSRLLPESAPVFGANLAALRRRLTALHDYGARVLASIPQRQRLLVTAHDAFGYFAARYGLEVDGIQGLSTESEANLARIEALVRALVERRIPAVFAESSVPDRAVRALIEGAGARGQRVALGGTLFSDSMGKPGTYEGTYHGMLDHNFTTIARALGGEAPARGMLGRLNIA